MRVFNKKQFDKWSKKNCIFYGDKRGKYYVVDGTGIQAFKDKQALEQWLHIKSLGACITNNK